jgi:hypothetical protein
MVPVSSANFRMQAPADDLRAAETEGWRAPAAPDPERYAYVREGCRI